MKTETLLDKHYNIMGSPVNYNPVIIGTLTKSLNEVSNKKSYMVEDIGSNISQFDESLVTIDPNWEYMDELETKIDMHKSRISFFTYRTAALSDPIAHDLKLEMRKYLNVQVQILAGYNLMHKLGTDINDLTPSNNTQEIYQTIKTQSRAAIAHYMPQEHKNNNDLANKLHNILNLKSAENKHGHITNLKNRIHKTLGSDFEASKLKTSSKNKAFIDYFNDNVQGEAVFDCDELRHALHQGAFDKMNNKYQNKLNKVTNLEALV